MLRMLLSPTQINFLLPDDEKALDWQQDESSELHGRQRTKYSKNHVWNTVFRLTWMLFSYEDPILAEAYPKCIAPCYHSKTRILGVVKFYSDTALLPGCAVRPLPSLLSTLLCIQRIIMCEMTPFIVDRRAFQKNSLFEQYRLSGTDTSRNTIRE